MCTVIQMAEKGKVEGSTQPSLGMKIALSTVRSRFWKVKHLSTRRLHTWMKETDGISTGDFPVTNEESNAATGTDKYDLDNKPVILLDTRPQEEFAVSHLPGAIRVDPNIDVSSLLTTLPLLNHSETSKQPAAIVCYCSLGYRSSSVAQKLQDIFHENKDLYSNIDVYNLDGSLFKWTNEGLPLVDADDKPTIFAHPFNAVWGKLLHRHLRREKPP